MVYEQQEWRNGDPSTPLSAGRLLHMEQGISDAVENSPEGREELADSDELKVFKRGSVLPLTTDEFGIRGDASWDDSAGFEAMVTAALQAGRREIRVPRGRYRLTRPIIIDVTDNTKWAAGLKIIGEGSGFARDGSVYGTLFEPAAGMTGAVIVVKGAPSTDNSNRGQINGVKLEDFGIRGRSDAPCNGIELSYYTNARISNVMVSDCVNAVKISRQANGATFGYANQLVIDQLFAVANRGWGIDAATAGALCGASIQSCNISENQAGGCRLVPGPTTLQSNIWTGNKGPALLILKPTGDSNATGPTVLGDHFETNGTVSVTPYAGGSAQVVIEYAQSPRFIGCNFLGSGFGENDIMAGHVDDVTGLYMAGNSHFGKSSVPSQAVIVAGPKLLRARIEDTEVFGYGGTTGRATAAQKYKSTVTNAHTYAFLAAGSIVDGATSVVPNAATVVFENVMIPVGAVLNFNIASQGGSVYASGIVRRSRDGNSITVVQTGGSADCTLSIVSGALRVTQTTATNPLLMFWAFTILQTI